MESASRRREKKSSGTEADADALLDSDVDVAVKRRVCIHCSSSGPMKFSDILDLFAQPTARQSIMAFLGDEDESD